MQVQNTVYNRIVVANRSTLTLNATRDLGFSAALLTNFYYHSITYIYARIYCNAYVLRMYVSVLNSFLIKFLGPVFNVVAFLFSLSIFVDIYWIVCDFTTMKRFRIRYPLQAMHSSAICRPIMWTFKTYFNTRHGQVINVIIYIIYSACLGVSFKPLHAPWRWWWLSS